MTPRRRLCLALLLALPWAGQASAAAPLGFARRVACRERVEDVYWRHRLWPPENPGRKPPLAAVLSRRQIAAKVEESLRYEAALADLWHRPLTAAVLQAELERQARSTRRPEVLHELWAALGDDPSLVAECLVRPELAERRVRDWFASDPRFQADVRAQAERELAEAKSVAGLRGGAAKVSEREWSAAAPAERAPGPRRSGGAVPRGGDGPEPERFAARVAALARDFAGPADDRAWAPRAAGAPAAGSNAQLAALPLGALSPLREDADRFYVRSLLGRDAGRLRVATVEWRKATFAEWWAGERSRHAPRLPPAASYRLPAVKTEACRDDAWSVPPGLALPDARSEHTAVWTGSEMIVWGGGLAGAAVNTGGRYNPATDSWVATSLVGAPVARRLHTAVWTGSEMIVWGGAGLADSYAPAGGRYAPGTDTWVATAASGAPQGRIEHAAIWTGTEMIVWGGYDGIFLGGGARYDPAADHWVATSLTGSPTARSNHAAVWSGTLMIVWGGYGCMDGVPTGCPYAALRSGGRYDPASDTWSPTGTTAAPTARQDPAAIWTGSEMIVFGGWVQGINSYPSDGGRYDPVADAWLATPLAGAPAPRAGHAAVWTGAELIVWGGASIAGPQNDGARYHPGSDHWVPMSATESPTAPSGAPAVWTGSEMIVWGAGRYAVGSGGRYDPATDAWTPTGTMATPDPRGSHAAVFTGSEMIVWGGLGANLLPMRSGGRYDLATDSWSPLDLAGAPSARQDPAAVWTGTEMIVWGGGYDSLTVLGDGGRYDPTAGSWAATSAAGAPGPRVSHTAVWSGQEMIVWGGEDINGHAFADGGRYAPATDSWVGTAATGAPAARSEHSAVWTGAEMVIWGGFGDLGSGPESSGARYDPVADHWTSTQLVGAPSARYFHTALWTGSAMVVWGGFDGTGNRLSSGARYNPSSDAWLPTSTTGAPLPRTGHTVLWTGTAMLVWGGSFGFGAFGESTDTGGRYYPVTDSWLPTGGAAPTMRENHTAIWTGSAMVVWGGWFGLPLRSGGLYCTTLNTPPLASGQTVLMHENGSAAILLGGTDPDGDALTYTIVSGPLHGALSGTPPSLSYTPATDFFGLDAFSFKVNDGRFDSNTAWVLIEVTRFPAPGIQVAPTSGLTTTESGGTASFTVALTARPYSDVTIGLSSSDTSQGTVSPGSVTFTASDWSTPQTVTVTGVDNQATDGDVGYSVVTAPAVSYDLGYHRLKAADVSVTNLERDLGGFFALVPCRLLDTRQSGPALAAQVVRALQITGACGVAAKAKAVAVNVTVIAPSRTSSLAAYAADRSASPPDTIIYFRKDRARAVGAVLSLPAGGAGTLDLLLAGGTADVVLDVTGFFE